MAVAPKYNEEKMDKMATAWETLAPNAKFANMTLADFKAVIAPCKQTRAELEQLEDQAKQKTIERDDNDKSFLTKAELVVNAIIGDVSFGPNSALYEAMGYVRKSDRKSGLTRKKTPTTQK